MEIQNANDHPFKVAIVQDADMFANDHPFKVYVEGGGGGGGEARVVTELPETGESGYIYLVLKEETSEGDIYDEWIWALQADGTTYGWEHLGTTNEVTIKLYDTEGDNTDGAATQRLVTSLKGKAKTLTTADYNYHNSGSVDDGVAAWLLDPGFYRTDRGVKIYWMSGTQGTSAAPLEFIVAKQGNSGDVAINVIPDGLIIDHSDGTNLLNTTYVKTSQVVDNLTSTLTGAPLSANQGKVLKDLADSLATRGAGAPTSSTVGLVGTLYEDTTNGKLYQCTAVSGSTYTWAELGGGGGGNVLELNYSEYNPTGAYPAPTSLGEWLFSKNIQGGQIIRLLNDNTSAYMYINLGTNERAETDLQVSYCRPALTFYVMACASDQNNRTYLSLLFGGNGSSQPEVWVWDKYGQTISLNYRKMLLDSGLIAKIGEDTYNKVLSADSGQALNTIAGVATNISGVGKVEVQPYGSGTTLTFNQTLNPWDFEWRGTMTLDSGSPYDFSSASVNDSVKVYVRDTSGLPLIYTPEYADEYTYEMTDTEGNTINVPGWRYTWDGNQQAVKVSITPGAFLTLKKFDSGWKFIAVGANATYLPRSNTTATITLTDTDPGEGQPLAENQFIGVY